MAQSFITELPSILKAERNIKSEEMEVFYNAMLNYLFSIYRNSFFFLYIASFHCLALDRLAKLQRSKIFSSKSTGKTPLSLTPAKSTVNRQKHPLASILNFHLLQLLCRVNSNRERTGSRGMLTSTRRRE